MKRFGIEEERFLLACAFLCVFLKDYQLLRSGFSENPASCIITPQASGECFRGSVEQGKEREEASNYERIVNHFLQHNEVSGIPRGPVYRGSSKVLEKQPRVYGLSLQ